MEVNPYAAPQTQVDDLAGFSAADLEARKASRSRRLSATLIDAVMLCVVVLSVFCLALMSSYSSGAKRDDHFALFILILLVLLLLIAIVNCVLLHKYGQTMGKRMLGIKVVRSNGDRASLGRIIGLRFLPVSLLGRIPLIGLLLTLVDCLMIFGNERRCLHDVFADTIVIQA
ncbi:RDD family protein [Dyella sp.]|uniref:RDD family protein n=1 Tax=Dyella sp. TaxID=1869338 RepID=UPI002ED34BCE